MTITNLTSADLVFTEGNHRYHVKDTKPKVYIPSVTTICGILDKPFLVEWAAREAAEAAVDAVLAYDGPMEDDTRDGFVAIGRQRHRDLREEGAATGTMVHHHVKQLLVPGWTPPEGEEVDLDSNLDAALAASAFNEWYYEHIVEAKCEVLLVEQMVVHPTGSYCGTFDLLVRKPNGRLRLIDWKTSNQSDSNPCALYPEYLLQTGAYVRAVEDTHEFREKGVMEKGEFIEDAQVVALGKNGQLAQTLLDSTSLDIYADTFLKLTEVLPNYRKAQGDIRAFNKIEKQRRADLAFEEHAAEATT